MWIYFWIKFCLKYKVNPFVTYLTNDYLESMWGEYYYENVIKPE